MKLRKFVQKYRVEFLLLAVAVVAILLLVGGNQIGAFKGQVESFFAIIGQFFKQIFVSLQLSFSSLSPTNLLAIGLLLLVALLIPWRIRSWIVSSPRFNLKVCPRCESKLHRSHRKFSDRVLGVVLFLSIRRYKCIDRNCGWQGLVTAQSRKPELEPFAK